MARQWLIPGNGLPFSGGMIDEDGVEEWFVPSVGFINEDQADAAVPTIHLVVAPYIPAER